MKHKVITLGKGKVSVGAGSIGDHAFINFDLLPRRRPIGTDLMNENREFLDTARIEILNLDAAYVLRNAVNAAIKTLEEL